MPAAKKKEPTKRNASSSTASAAAAKSSPSLPFYGGPENPIIDEHGKIKQWSLSCLDGRELKIYLENDCCANLTPKQVVVKFPQFSKYSYHTFNSAFQNCKKSICAILHNRKQVNCKYISVMCFFLFHL